MNQVDLRGRVAVITGGAQGIGYATAERMLASGASVVLWDIDAARLDQAVAALASRGPVSTDRVELTEEDSVAAAAAATLARQSSPAWSAATQAARWFPTWRP